jgi:putative hydrolase of the HAD superfamily
MIMIKAVAFDLWETLITDTPELSLRQEQLRLQRMEETLVARGYGATAERIVHAYRALWRRCHELYWSRDRDVPCRTQIEHFLEELELDPASFAEETLHELELAYANAAVDVLPALVPFAAETLRELKGRGLRIGLISNTGRTPGSALREVLARLGLGSSIDAMVFSNEHGECKPLPSIFTQLREGLGVEFAEVLFVGDNLYVDVHGAQSTGMRAVHFVPPVRGTAVAPHVEHGLEIVPDAVVTELRELAAVVNLLNVGS